MTIDFKHKFKNFASLLRGNSGPLVADHHVTPTDLKRKFAALLDYSEKKITTLFNHKDHQNVPIAVQLLLSLKKLALVEGFTNAVENRPLALLGHFVGYLVEPFITPTLSLSEQLTMLSAAAHLCCLLYRRNRTSFCPGQWYYDMQTFIKNIFWTTAKMKLLCPDGELFIGQDGTDRLEGNFGTYRDMYSAHNVDILELSQRAATAANVCRILAKHPTWDRGHRRLRLEGAEGVDHTNPKSWMGDVRVASVSLLTVWQAGARNVTKLLRSLHIELEQLPDDIDLLRPFGKDAGYVGLNEDFDWDSLHGVEQAASQPRRTTLPSADEENCQVELVDLLPEVGDRDLDASRKDSSHWLAVDGQDVHKAAAIRYFLMTDDGRKSTDRLARVQGVKKVRTFSRNPPPPKDDDDSIIGDRFLIGQFCATFIRVQNTAALAIIRVTTIRKTSGASVDSIPLADFASSSGITFVGQVLQLTQDSSTSTWSWTGSYESFNATDGGETAAITASKKSALLELPAHLTECVKPTLEQQTSGSDVYAWKFTSITLSALSEFMWDRVKSYQHLIPSRAPTPTFPMRSSGSPDFAFTSQEGSMALAAGPQEGFATCFLCGETVAIKKMRDHVGAHLLAKLLCLRDSRKLVSPIGDMPCGYCGRSGTCTTKLKKTKHAFKAESNCIFWNSFNIASAETPTQTGPSTNRPVVCKPCEERRPPQKGPNIDDDIVFWSYNMPKHVKTHHANIQLSEEFERSFAFGSRNERIYLKLEKGKPDETDKGMKKRRAQNSGEGSSAKKARHS
ncbi:uncharacterized protein B0H18DRAFT_1130674 [Fomitopsis serialis]|uniref:uncharacterized protein n=1 Tax=Fomitopsis serialis TaxID=139415 RepID=UPI002007426B|nr:uncharacterized protein B0H18DRAFT_1130674 [Neoantrodia serialis]KAH9910151.1 hypothetical protein B0H18DRAFT_1130674 [Neoantrodia serialis]